MKTLLVIFTYKYPYEPPTEQFLHMEVPYLNEKGADILFVPCAGNLSTKSRYDVCNIKDKPLKRDKITDILLGAKGLFAKEFRKENKIIRKAVSKDQKKKAKKYAMIHWLQGTMFCSRFKKQLDYIVNGYEKIVLYSYWLNPMAIGVALYKDYLQKKGKNVIAVSRAHGQGDMYLDNEMTKYRPFARLLDQNLDHIYSISERGIDHLKGHGINNGCLARLGVKARFDSKKQVDFDKKLIVSCSVINENKRVIEIAKAVAELKCRNVKWVHFGGGEKESELREWCTANMPDDVEWELKGWTDHGAIMQYYADNVPDVFINVSGVEGIPVSIMEAMSYSIPCIATDVGATAEIVHDGINGYLLAKDFSTEDASLALDKLLLPTQEEREAFKKNAYETWQFKYDADKNFREFTEDLLKD